MDKILIIEDEAEIAELEKDYLEIWNYIEGNPSKWEEDCFYVKEGLCVFVHR